MLIDFSNQLINRITFYDITCNAVGIYTADIVFRA